ncbi:MAG TPA: type II toxin-antitoxin system VapC family toxin [Ktedonobacteraceae bacterium]|nr:type II toxin-antitoxin system VapC family toxin [Ktedonobacteraceae bacterium]
MSTYFLDTSAIVKRYFLEQGHDWIVALCDSGQAQHIYISQVALVEVVATICRKAREQSVADEERDSLIDTFRQDCQHTYIIWPVTTAIYTIAGNLCRTYRLRAYDAVQLACVLGLRDEAVATETPKPIFICSDNDLINMAVAENLSIENPNNYR